MRVVIGTAGHIDHGKTTLLRVLTGIDADRLPEEQRRGMTIDVGYAHLALPDGTELDFVDVPGHDRLVGNMLVGAGEIDAALLVVAADDGASAQTLEHLELLDALGISLGMAAVTKADMAGPARAASVAEQVAALLARTSLAGAPVLVTAATTGEGLVALRTELSALAARVLATRVVAGRAADDAAVPTMPTLAIDRVFAVRGRGTVATGSLRGGRVAAGLVLRLVPAAGDVREVRVREVQIHGAPVEAADGGRTALLLAGVEAGVLRRGQVLTADPTITASSRLLVALRAPAGLAVRSRARTGVVPVAPADRERLRLHIGTDQAAALVIRGPREAIDLPDGSTLAILRLDAAVAAKPGDRFALRRPSPGSAAGGGVVLDAQPPRGISRRRMTAARAAALAVAPVGSPAAAAARLDLHGALLADGVWALAPDVDAALRARAVALVTAHHVAEPESPGLPLPTLRAALALAARRQVTLGRAAADEVARALTDGHIADGALARDGDRVRDPRRAAGPPPAVLAAMDRLEAALSAAAPPNLAEAARAAGCPPDGVRALEAAGRIVRLEDDLAWSGATYRVITKKALAMASAAPLTPAAFRDATGTSRKFVMAILDDLNRRGLLRRTDAGHVLGPKMLQRLAERAAAKPPDAAS